MVAGGRRKWTVMLVEMPDALAALDAIAAASFNRSIWLRRQLSGEERIPVFVPIQLS